MIVKQKDIKVKTENNQTYAEVTIPKLNRKTQKITNHIVKLDIDDIELILNKSVTINESKITLNDGSKRVTNRYAMVHNRALHRLIMSGELEDDLVVDHINGDSLDNRKSNLRVCSQYENSLNKSILYLDKDNIKRVKYLWKVKDELYASEIPKFYDKDNINIKYRVYRDFNSAINDLQGHLIKESNGFSRQLTEAEIAEIERVIESNPTSSDTNN